MRRKCHNLQLVVNGKKHLQYHLFFSLVRPTCSVQDQLALHSVTAQTKPKSRDVQAAAEEPEIMKKIMITDILSFFLQH